MHRPLRCRSGPDNSPRSRRGRPHHSFSKCDQRAAPLHASIRSICLFACLLLYGMAVQAERYTIPLLVSAPATGAPQGVVRILNATDESGTVEIYAIGNAGTRSGPATFTLDASAAVQFTAADLQSGNAALGLTGGIGTEVGDARLEIETDLSIVPLAFVRAADGTLSAMHDTVRGASVGGPGRYAYEVPIFNPASDVTQVSRLRLINPGDVQAAVTISGRDDSGAAATGGDVTLTLAAGGAQTLTAQQLEAGDAAIAGQLGAGTGKWRLTVSSDQPLQVVNIVAATAGYWNNLSTTAVPGAAPADLETLNERFLGNTVVYVSRTERYTLNAQTGERFSETAEIDGVTATSMGSYDYVGIGPDAGRLSLIYDDGHACASILYFSTRTGGGFVSHCTGNDYPADGIWLGGYWFVDSDEDDGGGPIDTTYGFDDMLPGVPTSGLFVPAALSGGSVTTNDTGTTIMLNVGGYFELSESTRYTCTSVDGCMVANGTVTQGSVTGRAAGTGEVDRFPSFRGASGPGEQSYTVGTGIDTLTLPVASGGNGALAYSLSPGVPGLTFNVSTRQLTGMPTTAGTYAMTYTVTDEDGDTDTLGFTISVRSATATEGSLGVCQVGMLLSPGQSCTYPGTADEFSVNARGRGSFLGRLAGIRIRINNETINGRVYDFATSHQGDGVWRIDRIAGSTEAPTTGGGGMEPEDSSPSFAADAGPGNRTYTAGTAIDTLTLPAASGGDGTLTYTLEPDVPGLTFSATTRRLTGTPTTAGNYAMTYTVSDEDGDPDTLSFVIVVETGGDGTEDQDAVNFVGVGGWDIAFSDDGVHWELVYEHDEGGCCFRDVAYGNGLWVVVGHGIILRSTDGRNWTRTVYEEQPNSESDLYYLQGVHYGGGRWVIVGSTSVLTSTDGRNWTVVYGDAWVDQDPNSNVFYGKDVGYGDGLWVAIGIGTFESSNGINWGALPFDRECSWLGGESVAFGAGRWFMGEPGGGVCTRTAEGDWIPFITSAEHYGWDIEYGNGDWVAVGYDGIATWETGGSHWYSVGQEGWWGANSVAYRDGRWIVGASDGPYYTDGEPKSGAGWTHVPTSQTGGTLLQFDGIAAKP